MDVIQDVIDFVNRLRGDNEPRALSREDVTADEWQEWLLWCEPWKEDA